MRATMSRAAPQCEQGVPPLPPTAPLREQPSHLSPQSHMPRPTRRRTAHAAQTSTAKTMTTVAGVNVIS